MTPYQLATEVRNAFDFRDRAKLEQALVLLVALADANRLAGRAALEAAPKPPAPIDPTGK